MTPGQYTSYNRESDTYTVTDSDGIRHELDLIATIRLGIGASPSAPPECLVCNAKEALDRLEQRHAAPGPAATSTKSEAFPEGNDGETGAA